MTYSFYDQIGELYTVKLMVTQNETTGGGDSSATVPYTVRVADVFDSEGNSIFVVKTTDATTGAVTYSSSNATITFGSGTAAGVSGDVNATTGEFTLSSDLSQTLLFNSATGAFASVGVSDDGTPTRTNSEYAGKCVNFSVVSLGDGHEAADSTFPQYNADSDNGGVEIDFSHLTQYSKGGTSEVTYQRGDADGNDAGNYAGTMSGISIDANGKVYGTYTNGETKCLAQICVATFSNPSGLEAEGESLFSASLNSGLFDGVGEEVSTSGSFTVGALEMSNVDLASEFTNMITTQRGFQANSRIITTSDTMLEELVNLKR
jgi:flagellar hook protein FlgE